MNSKFVSCQGHIYDCKNTAVDVNKHNHIFIFVKRLSPPPLASLAGRTKMRGGEERNRGGTKAGNEKDPLSVPFVSTSHQSAFSHTSCLISFVVFVYKSKDNKNPVCRRIHQDLGGDTGGVGEWARRSH